jgi:cysteine synthase B
MRSTYIKLPIAKFRKHVVEASFLLCLCHKLDLYPLYRISMPTATSISGTLLEAHGTTLLERIGNTPLVRLQELTLDLPGVQILGKAEWANPGGSVKDRAASAIVIDAMERGLLGPDGATPSKHLLDATSGNTGIAYAMLGANLGFPVTLAMPSNVSPERKKYLAAYGANIIWTDPAEGSDGAIRMARKLAAESPDRFFYADQYGNRNNWLSHYHTTANEIWRQTEGQVTHFIAGLGTSGTFMGTTRRLRELNPSIQCISMQPDSAFNGLEGLKHMATAIVPPIYDPTLADENINLETERAYAMCLRLARRSGLLVGVSAAGAAAAALQIAQREHAAGREAVIVTILCDSAEKYMSERFWTESGSAPAGARKETSHA